MAKIKAIIPLEKLFSELWPDLYDPSRNSHCPCDGHDDVNGSFEIKNGFAYCHAGCKAPNGGSRFDHLDLMVLHHGVTYKAATEMLVERFGIGVDGKRKPDTTKLGEIDTVYQYTDEHNKPLYEVVRYRPKDFRQRRRNGKGGYNWSLADTRRVLYRLPQVLEADSVWFCEGEKDAINLSALQLCGTTVAQGADREGRKWPQLCEKYQIHRPLKGKNVFVIPDNDAAGYPHAHAVAKSLVGSTASVKLLDLKQIWPEIPLKGDVSDLIERFGPQKAKRLLLDVAERTAEYQAPKPVKFGSSTCADLMAAEIPDIRWVVDGLLCEGLVVLAGSPKIGKSWMVLSFCLAIAAGTRALSHFTTSPGDVLYLTLDGSSRI